MKKMKKSALHILFVSEYYWPRAAGGEIWSKEFCEALAARGHDVTVIALDHADLPTEEIKNGVRILRPNVAGRRRIGRKLAANNLTQYVKAFVSVTPLDIIHVNASVMNVPVSKIAKRAEIGCVTSVHAFFGKHWNAISPLGWMIRWIEQRAMTCDKSDVMVVPSKYVQRTIKKETGKQTTVIEHWAQDKYPRPIKTPGALFVGSLEAIKNPLACIAAARDLKQPLTIIGRGSLEKQLQKDAKMAGVKITFLSELDHTETLARISGADLVLVPSLSESFSLVALDAVAQGTPVSGTAVGIIPELPIITFPPKRLPKRVSKSAQMKIQKRFNKKASVDAYLKIYNKVRK